MDNVAECVCVCVCVVQCLPFLFLIQWSLLPGPEKCERRSWFSSGACSMFFAWVLIPVTQFTSQLLCLCSERRDIKPRLQFAQWQTTQKACLPPLTSDSPRHFWMGSVITVMKSKRKGLLTFGLFALMNCKHFCFDVTNTEMTAIDVFFWCK